MSGPSTPIPGTPGTPGATPFVNASFAPAGGQQPATGAMGPPPAKDRPQRTYEYEVTDSLLGTGVDIREEENALAEYYAGSFGQDSRTGFPAHAPGGRGSFYGAGPATQPGAPVTTGQKEFEAALAEQKWNESAARLSATRAIEQSGPFLQLANLHARAEKCARQYNLDLNLDTKTQPVQKSRNPADYPVAPKINVTTRQGPDGAMVSVYGSVLPPDSFLIDQLALLSIATKHRVRELLEDADQIATTRQQTSHGVIPSDWADSAVPVDSAGLPVNDGETATRNIENGANGSTNPRKRSFDASNASGVGGRPSAPATNHLAQVLREMGRAEREAEELRLKKRQKRLLGDSAVNGSRAGSVAPGTPGSTAPEPEKAPTKKEQKKIAAQKHDASADNVNKTTMKFLGGGKKKYSWMSMGANTPSTPNKPTASAAGTPASASASASASKAPESKSLTQEGRYKLGSLREYSEKGKDIQLRDWITVLERDGREKFALQLAYMKLDASEPR
ncbi:putative tpa inducible protein [Diaporthe ampelina]|uniref:Transcription initiation factor TFIID subunit 4 n=1 Tax=Diaporthe ampelina TaxID=1214573 RepID=A0A0G2FVY9_9PEZI|nr:putative tpa inducible protein [Diaporthe ampelina]